MQFITKHQVPILDEHTIYDEDGQPLFELNAKKLRYIAGKANRRIKDTGDWVPIVIGHTKDDAAETEQPEIVGYAGKFQVQKFFRTGRKAITATFKFFKHALNKVKKYPRRSIELWLDTWTIDPISLLGASTPERDLGLLQMAKSGAKKLSIPFKERKPMDEKKLVSMVLKALEQSDVFQWVKSKMQEEEGQDEGLDQDIPGEELPGAEEEGQDPLGAGAEDTGEEEPLPVDPEAAPEEEVGKKPMQYGKRNMGDRIRMSRLERQVKGLESENKSLRLKFRRAEREAALIQLEAEGIDLDREEELEDTLSLSDEGFQKHLNKIVKKYQRAPIFNNEQYGSTAYAARPGNTRNTLSREDMKTVAAYANENSMSFEAALQQMHG